ncbi:hypothetical protein [Kribbella sp. NPDC049227]|uniref:hypothetical protein n=1 Tax=Kribbella sp. NPDC049227 TaxID=3364113 RepID=UPI00371C1FFA
MGHIVVVGAGFAGVWSAAGAALARGHADLRITVIAPNEQLVLRPRLYEPDLDLATVELDRILTPIGAEKILAAAGRVYIDLPFFPRWR